MTEPARAGRRLETVRIGFMPLLDAAILVVAARCGFARGQGIEIELVRETSWANVRDRLAIGHFDAAHLLAPIPLAAALGLMPYDVPLIAPFALGTGGNAITLSIALWDAMKAALPEVQANDPASTGAALRHALTRRAETGEKPPVLAVVHPFSSHNYELRYWLAAYGIDPDRDVTIAILPPPYMGDALAAGRIDGFCVGEPWNSRAALQGHGRMILTKQAIWPDSPEKVLAMRADWAKARGEVAERLLQACLESAQWCANPANRDDLVEIMGEASILGTGPEAILPALSACLPMADGPREVPGMIRFSGKHTNLIRAGHVEWYLAQMRRWNQSAPGADALGRARAAFSPAPTLRAMAQMGLAMPDPGFLDGPETGHFGLFDRP